MTTEGQYPDAQGFIPSRDEVDQTYDQLVNQSRQGSGLGSFFGAVMQATVEADDVIQFDESGALIEESRGDLGVDARDIYAAVRRNLEANKVEAEMNNEVGMVVTEDLFTRIGIKMLPSGSYFSNGDKRVTAASLEPSIESPSLFAEYLSQMRSGQGAESGLINDVALGLKQRIDFTIADPEHEEVAMDALRMWIELEPEYERLGVETGVTKTLRQYPHYWAEGVLPEFIEATSKGYVEIDGEEYHGWSPAKWAEDMSPEGLIERWGEAIDCMTATGMKNPDSDLYAAIKDHLADCLQRSIDSMAADSTYDYFVNNLAALRLIEERFSKQ